MDELEEEIENICREIRENNGKRPEWMLRLVELESQRWQNTLRRLAEYDSNPPGDDENNSPD